MALEAHELLFILVGQLTLVVRKLVTHRISDADWRFVFGVSGSLTGDTLPGLSET